MSKPNNIRIYYQDEYLVAIEKPAGFHVHTPESMLREGKTVWKNNLSIILRKQLEKEVFTVHRLDRATSGVMIFALSGGIAKKLQEQFQNRTIQKEYLCLVRGWLDDEGIISEPMTADLDEGPMMDAETSYETVYRFSINHRIGKYDQPRYSLMRVEPKTGRRHQIRRHFKKLSHPLIGDTTHGDGQHNRFWRAVTGNNLLLKAYSLKLKHPMTGKELHFQTRWNKTWHSVFEISGFCPFLR